MSDFSKALEASSAYLSDGLPKYGFARDPVRDSSAAFRRWWIRDFGWKRDIVELVYRRGGETSLHVNLIVRMPDELGSCPHRDLAGIGVQTPPIPRSLLFPSARVERYARGVYASVVKQLDWFSGYSSPVDCLLRVGDEDRNGPRGGEVLESIIAHLKKQAVPSAADK